MWDLSFLQLVPGLSIAAPRDGATLRAELREAVLRDDGPTVVRYPKSGVGEDIPAVRRVGGMDVLREGAPDSDTAVLVVAVGVMARTALAVADRVADQGISVTVVDPRWVKPVDDALPALAARHRLVVTMEDGGRVGGVGAAISQRLTDEKVGVPVLVFGLSQEFIEQGKRDAILTAQGLGAQDLARAVVEAVASTEPALAAEPA
jgi:1-deoxy-D-xylulose-5-phosphate synthase